MMVRITRKKNMKQKRPRLLGLLLWVIVVYPLLGMLLPLLLGMLGLWQESGGQKPVFGLLLWALLGLLFWLYFCLPGLRDDKSSI